MAKGNKYNMGGMYEGAEDRSKTSLSEASSKNMGPGQGQYKASTGSPIELGLSAQEFVPGGSAMKLRGETNEATQRPKAINKKIKADRGTFESIC